VGYLSTPEMIGAILPQAWLVTHDNKYLAGAQAAGVLGISPRTAQHDWAHGRQAMTDSPADPKSLFGKTLDVAAPADRAKPTNKRRHSRTRERSGP
jgi:hypothetical protein